MKIALDANAYSDWKRGIRWMDEISTADEVHVSATVIGELCYGFAPGKQEMANVAELEAFLSQPAVVVNRITDSTARHYAVLKKFLRFQGTPLPENDIWIAASSMEHAPCCSLATATLHACGSCECGGRKLRLSAAPEITPSFTILGLISSGLLLRRRTKNLR
ncbi:MAG: PIN domain-containing protein [Verrucomicrobiota bacterium]